MMRDLATLQMFNLAHFSRKPIEELRAEANAEVQAFRAGNDGFSMLFLEVLRVAEQSSNRFVSSSPVPRLAQLARSIYRDGPPVNTAPQAEKLQRAISAKTLNEIFLEIYPAHLTTPRREALASRFRYAVFATGKDR
jgi:hypothetical protein